MDGTEAIGTEGMAMGRVLEVTDEQYQTLIPVAETRGQTPEQVLADWLEELRDRDREPRHYETDEWLRHLGVSEEEIASSKRRVRDEAEQRYDADA